MQPPHVIPRTVNTTSRSVVLGGFGSASLRNACFPAPLTASISISMATESAIKTVADLDSKSTVALCTPSTSCSTEVIFFLQPPHVIPRTVNTTSRSAVLGGFGSVSLRNACFPAPLTTSIRSSTATESAIRTVADLDSKSTVALRTPSTSSRTEVIFFLQPPHDIPSTVNTTSRSAVLGALGSLSFKNASLPALRTAAISLSVATQSSSKTAADLASKSTVALWTPSTACNTSVIFFTHAPHVMPSTASRSSFRAAAMLRKDAGDARRDVRTRRE